MGASHSSLPSAFLFRVTKVYPREYVCRHFWTEQRARAWAGLQSGTFKWELVRIDSKDVTDHGLNAPAEVNEGARAATVHTEDGWYRSGIRMGQPEDPDDVGPGAVGRFREPLMTTRPIDGGHEVTFGNA